MQQRLMLIGEPLGLLIAESEGKLEAVENFSVAVAGAELNVAIALRRLGHSVSYMTKLGKDPFGTRVKNCLDNNKIETDLVSYSDTHVTGFMMKGSTNEGDPSIFYYRNGSAASTITCNDITSIDYDKFSYVHVTGIFPAISESCLNATRLLIQTARMRGKFITFDPNLRPQLWKNKNEMIATINELAVQSDIVMPGIQEARILTGYDNEKSAAEFYLNAGVKTVIVKLGALGAYTAQRNGTSFYTPGFALKKENIIDTVGAGDGFAGGVISALMEGLSLRESVSRGNAIGAIQLCFRGDNEGLPTREELESFQNLK